MSGRTIWIVRIIGIVVFLVLMYLLASLHSRLVKMNQEAGGRQSAVTGNCELRIADCELQCGRPGVNLTQRRRAAEERRLI